MVSPSRNVVVQCAMLSGLMLSFAATGMPARAALITINSTSLRTNHTENGASGSQLFTGTGIPTDTFRLSSGSVAFSRTDIDFFEQSGQTVLNFGITHTRTGLFQTDSTFSGTDSQQIRFTALENTVYEISGFYNVTDAGPATAQTPATRLNGRLFDVTAGQTLMNSFQLSRSTANEQFVVGGLGGDDQNAFSGSLTGNLITGHEYEFGFGALTATTFDLSSQTDSGSSAVGNINLTIGTSAVPEPSSLALLALSGLTLLGYGWRQRQRPDRSQ